MSIKLMSLVFEHYPRGGGEMLLALALADHADDDGTGIFRSHSKLALKIRQSERNVINHLNRMLSDGWIENIRAGGGRTVSEYRISSDWINAHPRGEKKISTGVKKFHPRGEEKTPPGVKKFHPRGEENDTRIDNHPSNHPFNHPLKSAPVARRVPKTEDPEGENPVYQGVIGRAVEAYGSSDPPRDLRAWLITDLRRLHIGVSDLLLRSLTIAIQLRLASSQRRGIDRAMRVLLLHQETAS